MRNWLGLGILLVVSGCAPQLAPPPRLPPREASEAERLQAYQQYRLREEGNNWTGWSWSRQDGKYTFEGIEPLLTSPEAEERVSSIKTRAAVVVPMAAVGGALLGMALGDAASGGHLFSGSTRAGLAITGGVVAVTGIAITIVWDPVSGLGGVYNRGLADSLALPPQTEP